MTPCLLCEQPFAMGDRGCVIGNVTADGAGELRWVHIECLLRSCVGETSARMITHGRPELRAVHRREP